MLNKTLWVFGDSNTAGHGCTPSFAYYQNYIKAGDKIWSEHLARYLKIDLINRGKGGSSNDIILDTIIDSFDKIKSDDIVIIGKTYSQRFDVPQENGLFPLFPDKLSEHDYNQFTLDEIKCIVDFQYYFMKSPLYEERWDKRMKFIKDILESKGCRCIVWDVWKDLKGIQTIKQATNNKIDDAHMSFKGHLDFGIHMWNKWFKEKSLL